VSAWSGRAHWGAEKRDHWGTCLVKTPRIQEKKKKTTPLNVKKQKRFTCPYGVDMNTLKKKGQPWTCPKRKKITKTTYTFHQGSHARGEKKQNFLPKPGHPVLGQKSGTDRSKENTR